MPPAIWKAGTVMPKSAKIAPPAPANVASIANAATQARRAERDRSPGERPSVIETKIDAAEIGLITEKRDENARIANRTSGDDMAPDDCVLCSRRVTTAPSPDLSPFYGLLTRRVQAARLAAAAPWLEGPGPFLDVGCGLTELPGRLRPYVGCDRNDVVLAENRRRFPEARFETWDVSAADAPPAVTDAGPFRTVLMLAILEHLPDAASALARTARLLAPGGRVVVTTPHPLGHAPLEIGARVGLLSRHADEEHEALLDRAALEKAGAAGGLALGAYRRFLAGLNQLAVFTGPPARPRA